VALIFGLSLGVLPLSAGDVAAQGSNNCGNATGVLSTTLGLALCLATASEAETGDGGDADASGGDGGDAQTEAMPSSRSGGRPVGRSTAATRASVSYRA
jgi:hypothetical protein